MDVNDTDIQIATLSAAAEQLQAVLPDLVESSRAVTEYALRYGSVFVRDEETEEALMNSAGVAGDITHPDRDLTKGSS